MNTKANKDGNKLPPVYAGRLIDLYREANNYNRDNHVAKDLNVTASMMSKIRSGIRAISDEESIFLAKGAKIDPEIAILWCNHDRASTHTLRLHWSKIIEVMESR
ncbi:hypothetical protein [Vibrio campbellii]|uniref:hypothetical protein n=1 Tax=Vibrio campbellii TaxID=680 RepID=UPI000CD33939|nr:hypothetical protein [Vibrio campbellii]AUW07417.1 hypothetical protein C1N51_27570 [Vibrio campbellii]